MKKYTSILAIACLFGFIACSGEAEIVEESTDSVELLLSDTIFEAKGGTGTIYLTVSSTSSLTAEPSDDWITITAVDADKVDFSVDSFSERYSRSGRITVTAGTASYVVAVTQKPATFTVDDTAIDVDPVGTETILGYVCTGATLEISIPEDAGWLTVTQEDDCLVFVGELNVGESRSTTVTLTCEWMSYYITVTQEVVHLITPTEVVIPVSGGDFIVEATGDMLSSVASWSLSTEDSWLSTSTNSDGTFTVKVDKNTTGEVREGTLTACSDDGVLLGKVNVTQNLAYGYDFFLGDWKMYYATSSSGDPTYELTLKVKEKEEEGAYTVSGMVFDVTFYYVLDENTGKDYLSFTTQYIGYNLADDGYYVYFNPQSAGSYAHASGYGFNFVPNDDNNDILSTLDNGVWGSKECDTISFRSYTAKNTDTSSSSNYKSGADPYGRYYNISDLTRQ